MSLKPKKVKNLEKEIPEIVKRDIEEINELSDEELMSVWSFFKFLITDTGKDEVRFLTPRGSVIGKYKDILMKKTKIKIEIMEEFMAG